MTLKHKIELLTAIILFVGAVLGITTQILSNKRPSEQAGSTSKRPSEPPATAQNKVQNTLVKSDSRFYCQLEADPNRGGEVWTVMYRSDKGTKAWLRMVRSMGNGFNTQKRCEEISRRLDIYRLDGLIGFDFRTDPNTSKQYVLCAKTTISNTGCPLVLTLMPKDDPYEELRKVAGALVPGSIPSYQCSNSQTCPPLKPFFISLDNQL
ncbi:COP23 domain-containing protein [Argonema antarcticum]|uniref:COP23 domain-containing protein n=1 Tax=Argonema antarcticum TaxID=2942763 RepID=UPI0020119349|nr:COP23 domain-containing protein [Argonema antarcticum]MCL1469265.1 COP23 domain-containing protein [Argonema antarcticum A004/B2]